MAISTIDQPRSKHDPGEGNDYKELKRRIVASGLLEKQLGYYATNIVIRLAILSTGVTLLIVIDNFWLQVLNTALLAFAFTHIGFLVHDSGHRQIFNTAYNNDHFGLATNLLLGFSRSWWIDTHNAHHANPNDLDLDPHTALPLLAFSEDQARSKRGPLRLLDGYQSFYFVPMLLLEGVGVRLASVQYLLRGEGKDRTLEALLMALHFVLYFGLLFYVLSFGQAIIFIVLHNALIGMYMGLVFAPNHKGMALIDSKSRIDFLRRQVLTSRNVSANPITDFIYGGLNYQIEHHLFPSMARNKLHEAQEIVKAFCAERGIPYCETSLVGSYRDLLGYLHEVSAPLRKKAA